MREGLLIVVAIAMQTETDWSNFTKCVCACTDCDSLCNSATLLFLLSGVRR